MRLVEHWHHLVRVPLRAHALLGRGGTAADKAEHLGALKTSSPAGALLTSAQEHKAHFYFPQHPAASDKCKDLIFRLIQDKEHRLCSKRYSVKDSRYLEGPHLVTDAFGCHVFPDDAEDIKGHRWFRAIPWDRLQTIRPPFVPRIHSAEDTHYFDDSEPMEGWVASDRSEADALSPDEVKAVLGDFGSHVHRYAIQLVATPCHSSTLREAQQQIDELDRLSGEEREALKQFVHLYGRKERKRPRDRLLRDEQSKKIVMEVRKKTAFSGYSWQRRRPGGYARPQWL